MTRDTSPSKYLPALGNKCACRIFRNQRFQLLIRIIRGIDPGIESTPITIQIKFTPENQDTQNNEKPNWNRSKCYRWLDFVLPGRRNWLAGRSVFLAGFHLVTGGFVTPGEITFVPIAFVPSADMRLFVPFFGGSGASK